jgi:uncharacterized protein (TIGR02996 family)
MTTHFAHGNLVTPWLVRRAIEHALANGWARDRPGPAQAFAFDGILPDRTLPTSAATLTATLAPTEAQLLDAIAAEPEGQDAARLVYADWLLERGDDNGEMIALACAEARRRLDGAERARLDELCVTRHTRWLGPVAAVTMQQRWSRGLLDACTLGKNAPGVVAPALGHRAWSTVTRLDGRGAFLATDDVVALVTQPALRSLRSLTISLAVAQKLARQPSSPALERLTELAIIGPPSSLPKLVFPSLRRLAINADPGDAWAPALFARPFGATLTSLVILGHNRALLADWLQLLERHAGPELVELRLQWAWRALEGNDFESHIRVRRGEGGAWAAYELAGGLAR